MLLKQPELMACSYISYLRCSTVFMIQTILMMKASFGGGSARQGGSPPQRIKVSKRSVIIPSGGSNPTEQQPKASLDLASALEHEKQMSQSYRQKNQKNIMKCRFLYNKLNALGNLEGVPEMVGAEVSEVDIRIKQLENLLKFKQSQQMKKLKRKVTIFLQLINFDVAAQDFDKIQDQIEIILFLLDIFEEKFNEMTAERKQIDEILTKLEQQSTLKQPEHNHKKEQELLLKISMLQAELQRLKNEEIKKIEHQILKRQPSNIPSVTQQQIIKIQELQKAQKLIKNMQLQGNDIRARLQVVNGNLQRAKREQARWKQRYRLMEAQKDERIKMLEESISKNLSK